MERLQQEYDRLCKHIQKLEQERTLNRDFKHKTLLTGLKKQRLALKDKLKKYET